jgi:divalent metal cation (Fe/Co/Zn/Cd) transporter
MTVPASQATAVQSGIRIEVLTIFWMVIEASVSISAGVLAGSVLLTAFGVDSIIELVSGAILLWRLRVEAQEKNTAQVERAEKQAAWVVGISLALLCLYVLFTALYGLLTGSKSESSPVGIAISAVAVLVMPWFAATKRQIAEQIHSGALRGDAACSLTCAYMAGTVLAGLVLNTLFHWWWAENIAALLFLYWLVQETRETLEQARGVEQESDDD